MSLSEDTNTIAQYAAAKKEFETENTRNRMELVSLVQMANAVVSKCARMVELTNMIDNPPPKVVQKVKEHESLAAKTWAKALALATEEEDFAIKRWEFDATYRTHSNNACKTLKEYRAPFRVECNQISDWFNTTPSALTTKSEMIVTLVHINRALPHNQKIKLHLNIDALIAENIALINADILTRIDTNARALTEYNAGKLTPDRFATSADFAQAIHAAAPNCSICLNPILAAPFTTKCNHTFHAHCIAAWRRTDGITCPNCRTLIE